MSPLIMQQALTTGGFTQVELLWVAKRIETWIRFGRPATNLIIDDRRRLVSFAPNSVFALVHWAANDYGTIRSEIHIVRAVAPGKPIALVPDIRPGADIFLHIGGWPKVEKVLHAIDAIDALGVDPADAAPDYWPHVSNRLSGNEQPRLYTLDRHKAWLRRRRVTP